MAIILQSDNDKNLESDLLLVCIPLAEVHLGFIKIILKSIITVIIIITVILEWDTSVVQFCELHCDPNTGFFKQFKDR